MTVESINETIFTISVKLELYQASFNVWEQD